MPATAIAPSSAGGPRRSSRHLTNRRSRVSQRPSSRTSSSRSRKSRGSGSSLGPPVGDGAAGGGDDRGPVLVEVHDARARHVAREHRLGSAPALMTRLARRSVYAPGTRRSPRPRTRSTPARRRRAGVDERLGLGGGGARTSPYRSLRRPRRRPVAVRVPRPARRRARPRRQQHDQRQQQRAQARVTGSARSRAATRRYLARAEAVRGPRAPPRSGPAGRLRCRPWRRAGRGCSTSCDGIRRRCCWPASCSPSWPTRSSATSILGRAALGVDRDGRWSLVALYAVRRTPALAWVALILGAPAVVFNAARGRAPRQRRGRAAPRPCCTRRSTSTCPTG